MTILKFCYWVWWIELQLLPDLRRMSSHSSFHLVQLHVEVFSLFFILLTVRLFMRSGKCFVVSFFTTIVTLLSIGRTSLRWVTGSTVLTWTFPSIITFSSTITSVMTTVLCFPLKPHGPLDLGLPLVTTSTFWLCLSTLARKFCPSFLTCTVPSVKLGYLQAIL